MQLTYFFYLVLCYDTYKRLSMDELALLRALSGREGKMSVITQPFTTPAEVVSFIADCVAHNDPEWLYSACLRPPSDFWKPYLIQYLAEIQQTETLARVFLEDDQITDFPVNADRYLLGGHAIRTRYLHISLERQAGGWFLAEIYVCR